jgi:hypothetical protein
MRKAVRAVSAFVLGGSLTAALATRPAYHVDVENETKAAVEVELKSYYPGDPNTYYPKAYYRTPPTEFDERRLSFSEVLKLEPGQVKRFYFVGFAYWVRWCQVKPKTSKPCEVLEGRPEGSVVVIE